MGWWSGALLGPIGDHFHVATGVTEYLTTVGIIWLGNSPLWFALLVGGLIGGLAAFIGVMARGEPGRAPLGLVIVSPLIVLGLYLTTSFYPWRDGGSLELLMTAAAVAMALVFDRSRLGVVVGVVAAVGATAFEFMLVQLGVFRYLPGSDELFGVAPSLLPLYFAASICAGAVGRRLLARG